MTTDLVNNKIVKDFLLGIADPERCLKILGWRGPAFPFILENEVMIMGQHIKNIFIDRIDAGELILLNSFNVIVFSDIDPEIKILIEQYLLKILTPNFFNTFK